MTRNPYGLIEREQNSVQERSAVYSKQKLEKIYKSVYKPFPFTTFFLGLILAVLFALIVVTNIEIDAQRESVIALEAELAELHEQEAELNASLEKKINLEEIEKIAVEEYGMVKSKDLPVKYVSVDNEDKVQLVYVEDEGEAGFNLFSIIGRGFRTMLGIQ